MENSSGSEDLIDAVYYALEQRGSISQLKSKIRAEVFQVLEDKTVVLPEKPRDVYLVGELIRDYLSILKLDNTNSVFCEEGGQPSEMRVDREFLGEELGLRLQDSDQSIPLLLLLVQHLRNQKESRITQLFSSSNSTANSMINEIGSL